MPAASDEIKVTKRQHALSAVVGVGGLIGIIVVSLFLPNPSPWQQFVLKLCIGLAAGAAASCIPGFINVSAKMKGWGNYFTIFAGGAIAIFVLAYFISPPVINPYQDARSGSSPISAPPSSQVMKDILGIWYFEYTYPVKGGTSTTRGTSEYFANNTYNFVGQFSSSVVDGKSNKIEMLEDVDSSNEWVATETDLTIKMVDPKSQLKIFKINNMVLPISSILGLHTGLIQSLVPRGTSEHFRIMSLDSNTMHLQGKDPLGGSFDFVATRAKGRFTRS